MCQHIVCVWGPVARMCCVPGELSASMSPYIRHWLTQGASGALYIQQGQLPSPSAW